MGTELVYSDATKLAELIRIREISPVEVMKAHLDRIETVNPKVNAIVTLAEHAMADAKAAEAAVLNGEPLGPLHGVPFTVKDSIDTAGVLTQRGSPIFKGRLPGMDATSVARLKKAGGILLEKTNQPEFSYWIESDNLLTGRTNNPWNLTRTPCGSSVNGAEAWFHQPAHAELPARCACQPRPRSGRDAYPNERWWHLPDALRQKIPKRRSYVGRYAIRLHGIASFASMCQAMPKRSSRTVRSMALRCSRVRFCIRAASSSTTFACTSQLDVAAHGGNPVINHIFT